MILIVPDVHGRKFWKEPCDSIDKYEKIVFLGDYVDPYEYEGITKEEAVENFKEIISFARMNNGKVILLLGNHCLPYISEYFLNNACGGRHDKERHDEIKSLYLNNMDLFSLVYEYMVNGKRYLFSHAGICKSWFNKYQDKIKDLTESSINSLLDSEDGMKALCDVGLSRWGYDYVGSIVWADCGDHSFNAEKIDGIYQIFGHSQQESEPIIKDNYACLDVRKCFELSDNGVISPYNKEENEKVKTNEKQQPNKDT